MNVIISFTLFLINTICSLIGMSIDDVNIQEQVIPKKEKIEWIVYQGENRKDGSREYK
ncbi:MULTISPECIES: hypothetical protein [Myroides]|uniref:Uncharacterized protein n=1 Tax=Myroides albus TaxID=2562892 RepID=A0A6I3LJ84_9FLAO|nr:MULTISPECIES: hypothetical protein [Myroides]MTG98313.1 hypothetical protein [Myroides albus]MVX35706.1 hypothetical protein [Myroides sp. LoEW2-1]UVD79614.1 hypothetical protein NWE55_16065 [Myroides albus]